MEYIVDYVMAITIFTITLSVFMYCLIGGILVHETLMPPVRPPATYHFPHEINVERTSAVVHIKTEQPITVIIYIIRPGGDGYEWRCYKSIAPLSIRASDTDWIVVFSYSSVAVLKGSSIPVAEIVIDRYDVNPIFPMPPYVVIFHDDYKIVPNLTPGSGSEYVTKNMTLVLAGD